MKECVCMKKLKKWQFWLLVIFYPIGMIYFIYWIVKRSQSSYQPKKTFSTPPATYPVQRFSTLPDNQISTNNSEYEYKRIKVVGVTFKNGNKSRQAILRKLKFRDGEFEDSVSLDLREYQYNGSPAYGIYANDQQIGNIPADTVEWVKNNFERIISFADIEVYGGGNREDGSKINYGAEIVLKLKCISDVY